MREPYVLFGLRLHAGTNNPNALVSRIIDDIEAALAPRPVTSLKVSDVYIFHATPSTSVEAWRQISQILVDYDTQLGDALQWFAQLSDRNGNELSFN